MGRAVKRRGTAPERGAAYAKALAYQDGHLLEESNGSRPESAAPSPKRAMKREGWGPRAALVREASENKARDWEVGVGKCHRLIIVLKTSLRQLPGRLTECGRPIQTGGVLLSLLKTGGGPVLGRVFFSPLPSSFPFSLLVSVFSRLRFNILDLGLGSERLQMARVVERGSQGTSSPESCQCHTSHPCRAAATSRQNVKQLGTGSSCSEQLCVLSEHHKQNGQVSAEITSWPSPVLPCTPGWALSSSICFWYLQSPQCGVRL